MPIYEYACNGCGQRFEKLVRRFAEEVSCPGCASASVDKQLSVFAVGASGSTSRASSGVRLRRSRGGLRRRSVRRRGLRPPELGG